MKYYDSNKVAALLAAVANLQANWTKNLSEPMAILTAAAGECKPETPPASVWVVAEDTKHGTYIQEFKTQHAVYEYLFAQLWKDDTESDAAKAAMVFLETKAYDEFDDLFDDHRDSMDTYTWEEIKFQPPPAKVVVEIEGGVLQDFTANVPLELYRFDWDNIEDPDHDHDGDAEPETDDGTPERFQSAFDACLERAKQIQVDKPTAEA